MDGGVASALHQAPPPSNQVSLSTLLHCPRFLLVSRHSVVCRLEHGTRRPRLQQRVHAFSLRLRRGALFRHSLRGGGRRSSSMIYAATFGERPVLLRVVAKAARQHTSRDQRACTSFSNVFSVLIFQSMCAALGLEPCGGTAFAHATERRPVRAAYGAPDGAPLSLWELGISKRYDHPSRSYLGLSCKLPRISDLARFWRKAEAASCEQIEGTNQPRPPRIKKLHQPLSLTQRIVRRPTKKPTQIGCGFETDALHESSLSCRG